MKKTSLTVAYIALLIVQIIRFIQLSPSIWACLIVAGMLITGGFVLWFKKPRSM